MIAGTAKLGMGARIALSHAADRGVALRSRRAHGCASSPAALWPLYSFTEQVELSVPIIVEGEVGNSRVAGRSLRTTMFDGNFSAGLRYQLPGFSPRGLRAGSRTALWEKRHGELGGVSSVGPFAPVSCVIGS